MDTMLSRSGRSNADGKLTCRFDIPVSDELNEAVIALATIEGLSKAEWLRNLIEETVYGRLNMMRKFARITPPRPSDEYPTIDRGRP
jgi:hypothetical protein